jgi:peptidoglycan hydrolase CwlO-like protein
MYSLADELGDALKEFSESRLLDAAGIGNPLAASKLNAIIAKAYAHGVIVETNQDELEKQLKSKDDEIGALKQQKEELETELAKLSEKVIHWQSKYNELDSRLKEMFKRKQGDDASGV